MGVDVDRCVFFMSHGANEWQSPGLPQQKQLDLVMVVDKSFSFTSHLSSSSSYLLKLAKGWFRQSVTCPIKDGMLQRVSRVSRVSAKASRTVSRSVS